ncbi:hypothetical protein BWQ96_02213 [Gracilariopsis chorda]|uniref:Uncharacterized protein n=1 Tax=Gracilariopsis chorda TaxID=448386 RepID=A0A2V3J0S9_9FLOR|nr:hypothetical protein BWQ96_02213 [Gracilariopsis chorda]|eukprot:PXF48022.1 hypothetical protein BWQ96_02213 [Gracilariopsis chorda]
MDCKRDEGVGALSFENGTADKMVYSLQNAAMNLTTTGIGRKNAHTLTHEE